MEEKNLTEKGNDRTNVPEVRMSLAKAGDHGWSYLAGVNAIEWGVLGNKGQKGQAGPCDGRLCEAEEVKHDATSSAIQEKKFRNIPTICCAQNEPYPFYSPLFQNFSYCYCWYVTGPRWP